MSSPFKLLDPYDKGDRTIFFGRDEEIEELYRLVFQTNLVLVYGRSGTGKTSLIRCGLANRFQETDWLQVYVRRLDDINASLIGAIRALATTPIATDASVPDAVHSLYLDHLRPVYLIFDQFEELFARGGEAEQQTFFATVAALMSADLSCRIIISLREEYLAALHRFETTVPALFSRRLRVEPMTQVKAEQVVIGTTAAFNIVLESGAATARSIVTKLDDARDGVELAYLQVFLDGLYRRADSAAHVGPIVFTDAAVNDTGELGTLMEDFLKNQSESIQSSSSASRPDIPSDLVQRVLEEFVTVEGAKRPTGRDALARELPKLDPRWIDETLDALQSARILRIVGTDYELSHDAFARSIAAQRSAESRIALYVEAMIRNKRAVSELKSWLEPDDLAIIRRVRPLLDLTPDEIKFVDDSAKRARRRSIRRVTFHILLAPLITLSLALIYFLGESEVYRAMGWEWPPPMECTDECRSQP